MKGIDLEEINILCTMLENKLTKCTNEEIDNLIKRLKEYGGFVASTLIYRLEVVKEMK